MAAAALAWLLAAASAGEPPRLKDSEFARLEDRWVELMKAGKVPGFAVVIVRGDQVVALDAFGVRDVDSGKPATPDTMFYIASCTKPFNALCTLALAEDGKLALDEPVKKYLPRFQLSDPALADTVTVRDLLCHRWGIQSRDIVFADAYSGLITDDLYYALLPMADVRRQVMYSNVHFTLAGRVIQSVAGMDWRDALEQRVLKAAGMSRTTGYASRMYTDPDVALPHVFDGERVRVSPLRKTDRTMHAAGGLGTTARDLGRWLRLQLGGGTIDGRRIVSAAGMKQVLSEQSRLPQPMGRIRREEAFGLGWEMGHFRDKGPFYMHGGDYVGASAYMAFLPGERVGMAVLVNAGEAGGLLSALVNVDVFDAVLGNQPDDNLFSGYIKEAKANRSKPAMEPEIREPAPGAGLTLPLERYAGKFANDVAGVLEFRAEQGRLAARLGDLEFRLATRGDDVLEAIAAPGISFRCRFELKDGRADAVVLSEPPSATKDRRFERQPSGSK